MKGLHEIKISSRKEFVNERRGEYLKLKSRLQSSLCIVMQSQLLGASGAVCYHMSSLRYCVMFGQRNPHCVAYFCVFSLDS